MYVKRAVMRQICYIDTQRSEKEREGKREKKNNNENKLLKCTKEEEEKVARAGAGLSQSFCVDFCTEGGGQFGIGNGLFTQPNRQTNIQTICSRTYHLSSSSAATTYDVSKTLCMRILTNDRQQMG